MNNDENNCRSDMAGILLLGAGIILIFSSVLYNEYLVVQFDPRPPLEDITVRKIRLMEVYFLLEGLTLIIFSAFVRRISWLNVFMNKKITINILLSFLSLLLLISILELSLRPFANLATKTSVFIRDNELGWRFRPGAEDSWGDVKIKINSKGLRGPELDYFKPLNTFRIHYLGDSVTVGYGIRRYEQTFPFLIEMILEGKLGKEIETINAGVDGYSQWQEYIYLAREGIKYNPDLVIVSFVLNDVTEKFGLVRFGGSSEGYQLSRSFSSWFDRLCSMSSTLYFAKKIADIMVFGRDVQKGASDKETLNIESLIACPQDFKNAWDMTLKDLGDISDFCKSRGISIILVVFPFPVQFDRIETKRSPQNILNDYALNNNIPVIDFLPIFDKIISNQESKTVLNDYFLDYWGHLSPLGNEMAAKTIADFIQRENMINHF